MQAVIGRARERLGAQGRRTVLFIDEIHRFNKTQQDALLPVVESGLVTLIGATTENPFHSIIGALVSRCRLYEFEGHSEEDLLAVLERGAAALGDPPVESDVLAAIAATAAGDARHALSTLELAHEHAASRGDGAVSEEDVAAAVLRRPVRYDRDGDNHYDTISAFIKSVRASDPDAALFYLAVMLEGGEDPVYIARRIAILASEDIGNADPRALELAVACARVVELVGLPECRYALSQATAYLALAPKSNAAATSLGAAPRPRARTPRPGRRRPCATPATEARSSSAAASATAIRTTRPGGSWPTTTCRPSSRARASTSPASRARGQAGRAPARAAAAARGE